MLCWTPAAEGTWVFTDVTASTGVLYEHGCTQPTLSEPRLFAGGIAAGDYDGDGWIDLYAVRGTIGPNLLFHNRGDGTFEEVGAAAGVALSGTYGAGPTFADFDGDGWLDLLVLGVNGTSSALFRNRGDGRFEEVSEQSGLWLTDDSYSASFGDYDGDGDLDVFISHWYFTGATRNLWRNNGDGTFTDVSGMAGVFGATDVPHTFTGNFADINSDGWPDLLVAADFGTSRVLLNNANGTFTDTTNSTISDENGMGAAVGDYDNDGDLDWFVSSIWDPDGIVVGGNWGVTGNRLYRNRGDGTFEDATDGAGVRYGYWGWGSTFADLNNDGVLDLYHVNGFGGPGVGDTGEFIADPARLYVGGDNGVFTEHGHELGADDPLQGRGVVAFDYDRDGDLDLFIANNGGPSRLLRNDGGNRGHFLTVKLRGRGANSEAIGARVLVRTATRVQLRELRAGNNFESQDPAEAHFGLGDRTVIDELQVRWPRGATTTLHELPADQFLVLTEPQPGAHCDTANPSCIPGGRAQRTDCLLEWQVAFPATADMLRGNLVCTDGDTACDQDADASNHSCTFRVALCVNNADARLADCALHGVRDVRVRRPRAQSTGPGDGMNFAALAQHIGNVSGGLGLAVRNGVRRVFANVSPNLCTEPFPLVVPQRTDAAGSFTVGRKLVRVSAFVSTGGRDTDALRFACRPAAAGRLSGAGGPRGDRTNRVTTAPSRGERQ